VFNFFGKYFKVTTYEGSTTLRFALNDIDKEAFDYRRWSSGQKLLKYLQQERALFGYLIVLLDCESYLGKSVRKINAFRTGVNPAVLSEVLNNECKDAEDVAEYLINDTTRALEELLEEVFNVDVQNAHDRMKELVKEVKRQIEDDEDSLVFLS
jgi:hypothetical protein